MAISDPSALLEKLTAQPRETEWLEFKENKFDPCEVGEYVSALANSAMLANEPHGYLVFGVEDKTHRIVGTSVSLKDEMVGNEVFENWLARWVEPRINLEILQFEYKTHSIALIIIDPAYQRPVSFKNERYIRIASVKKLLREYPERERTLWQVTSRFAFEQGIAASHFSAKDIIANFNCDHLLGALDKPTSTQKVIINQLLMEELIVDDKQNGFDVTNLLAIIAAKDLKRFPAIHKKAIRIINYKGSNQLIGISDRTGEIGYATAFPKIIKYIMELIPHKEEMNQGLRVTVYMYPEIAIRELVANALIHQDFTTIGDAPKVEIFTDKIVITNPGSPLVPPERFIDAPSKSRNERLAGMMRRLGICEERGSGIDRALDAIEKSSMPPPLFREVESSTVVTIFASRSFGQMTKEERIRACYQHASLRFQSKDAMRNGSLRLRFGLPTNQYSQVSIVIKETIEAELIRPLDSEQGNRNARYVPYWA